jgi:DMSO/TMAO reductase YedYZ molybdopterin-dependent catalytic subunit
MKSRRVVLWIGLVLFVLAGCTSRQSTSALPEAATSTPPAVATSTPLAAATNTSPVAETPMPSQCVLPAVIPPTPPAETPGYVELDPDTGLHMTGEPQQIDLDSYRLHITGKVDNPLDLTYDDLRCLPKIEKRVTLTCPGFFVDEATWAGTPFRDVLALADVQQDAFGLRLISADGYTTIVTMGTALSELSFLAYEWEGEPLPILHGFPVRAVFPEESGGSWVKWLVEIEVY